MSRREREVSRIYHAPWSRRFTTFWLAGSVAYELQFGPYVIQWFYHPWHGAKFFKRLHVWKTSFWR